MSSITVARTSPRASSTSPAGSASTTSPILIATVSSAEKAERARAGGAAHVINYRSEDVAARVLDITGGVGVDHIAELDRHGKLGRKGGTRPRRRRRSCHQLP